MANYTKRGARTAMVLSYLAFEPRYCASYCGTTCGGGPCSLSSLTADAKSAISLTGSNLCDLGGADLLGYLVRDGRLGASQYTAEPWRVLRYLSRQSREVS